MSSLMAEIIYSICMTAGYCIGFHIIWARVNHVKYTTRWRQPILNTIVFVSGLSLFLWAIEMLDKSATGAVYVLGWVGSLIIFVAIVIFLEILLIDKDPEGDKVSEWLFVAGKPSNDDDTQENIEN